MAVVQTHMRLNYQQERGVQGKLHHLGCLQWVGKCAVSGLRTICRAVEAMYAQGCLCGQRMYGVSCTNLLHDHCPGYILYGKQGNRLKPTLGKFFLEQRRE
eukprot:GHRR01028338.1.p1 GENE.GHRR01028338.1~~GHRR01028338.1.p1  ORF type:complete len:101 (+),score=2.86 GHRR01028338.1:150-452(+)